jgi:hypothetical protein
MPGQIARSRGKAAYRRAASIGGLKNTVAPAITGTARVGFTLTVTNGTWTGPARAFTRQWMRGAVEVGNGGTTYVPVIGDIGSAITCVVTAVGAANIAGAGAAAKATSNATAAVIAA